MKVLFLLGNLYIYTEPYNRISEILRGSGVNTSFYYLPSGVNKNYEELNSARKLNINRLPVLGDGKVKESLTGKFMNFLLLILDRNKIRALLKKEKPDIVVSGGDITDAYGRIFHDTCSSMGIKVIMVPVTIPAPTVVHPDPDKNIPLPRVSRFILRLFGLEHAVFFRGWVLGSYHKDALITVPNGETQGLLRANSIPLERIVITGNPSHDMLHEVSSLRYEEARSAACSQLKLPHGSRIIVYCTEMIQDFYGLNYLKNINRLLCEAFDKLPMDCRVVVKLHPREPDSIESLLKQSFNDERYRVVRDMDLMRLLRAADLAISHYSAVLIDAALIGTIVLSIRDIEDAAPVRFGKINEYTHITREEQIAGKITDALMNKDFREMQKNNISKWREETGFNIDGMSSNRIARAITKLAAK